ncbi:MAG: prepilin-type N-terminal cleavage/methylation domain-containing protein [Desulfobacterales bacterium]|nr:MAG: prepilin-type N-terminal cleavage/methylation domain-containing protein [Desulfobacterales bacterium]
MSKFPGFKKSSRNSYLNEDLYGPLLRWKGFTLPELMFVVVLVSITAVLAVQKFDLLH